jgi:hypothetical protein
MGSGERGQLGNGRTGEHIVTSGRTVFDSEDKPSTSLRYPQNSCVRLFLD